ncbi:S-adenosyl-L-methionine-dependent methyltransferase [Bisporella sp. PMI_857]|nr:S-adenosyl-L-methionine-dependent methyltransferase [Bisporella sp. PMI_857]
MPFSSPIRAAKHVLELLDRLHHQSLEQEAAINPKGKFTSTDYIGDGEDKQPAFARADFDDIMRDKFIALDKDKCHFVYQLIGAMGATNVVEAGTSYGVSTIYLALAVAQNNALLKKQGKVFATEKEPEKAAKAKAYWKECGEEVEKVIEFRVGDLLDTLKSDLPQIDLLLLDIWTPLALPTLRIVQERLRPGAVVLVDNTISGATGYRDLLEYLNAPDSGFQNMTVPFTNGFEMSVYIP